MKKKTKISKRLLGLILSFIMAVLIIPFNDIVSMAQEENTDIIIETVSGYNTLEYSKEEIALLDSQLEQSISSKSEELKSEFAKETVELEVVYPARPEELANQIRNLMINRTTVVEVSAKLADYYAGQTITKEKLGEYFSQAMEIALSENPSPKGGDYLNWNLRNYDGTVSYSFSADLAKFKLNFEYYSTLEQENAVDAEVKRLLTIGELVYLSNEVDEYKKAEAIYSYLTSTIKYDEGTDKIKHSTYAALISKSAVCQGISTAYYRIARELGLSARLIAQTSVLDGPHGWNIVRIGAEYYNLDATWDLGTDPSNRKYFLLGSNNNKFKDKYHARDIEYNNSEFHSLYPTSTADYTQQSGALGVRYKAHVQDIGWQNYVYNGQASGTSGQSKRVEGFNIELVNKGNLDLGIKYRSHVQDIGWQDYVADNAMTGTSGQSKRVEALQISLTGNDASKYNVYYRVHVQDYGWLGWAKNGEPAGTSGQSKRIEALQIVVIPSQNGQVPGGLNGYSYVAYGLTPENLVASNLVKYNTHIQDIGWQHSVGDGSISGTFGMSKRLEGINISLDKPGVSGGIKYKTHVQDYGWQNYVENGVMSGTSGQAKRLEAISIQLTGEAANVYDVYYRVHVQDFGWLGWAKNGSDAGTSGMSKRLEGIQIITVKKGSGSAFFDTNNSYLSN